jgi:hypothetical protein
VLDAVVAVVVEEVLVSANKASLSVAFLTLVAILGVPLAAASTVYVAQASLAPIRQRRELLDGLRVEREAARRSAEQGDERFKEADTNWRDAFDRKWKETEQLRKLLGEAEKRARDAEDALKAQAEGHKKNIQSYLTERARIERRYGSNIIQAPPEVLAARRIRSELLDAKRMASTYADAVAKLPASRTIHYEKGFRFSTSQWQQHGGVLAGHADLYALVERAYQEIGRANDVIGWRESGAKGSYGVNRQEDDLPAVARAADEAISALDELLNPTNKHGPGDDPNIPNGR